MVAQKVVISVLSLILVVGAVAGIVAIVSYHSSGGDNENDTDNKSSSAMKTMMTICAQTVHKDACEWSLGTVAKNESATPKDFVFTAIQAAKNEVNKALQVVGDHKVDEEEDERSNMGVEECKKLLNYAVEDLDSSLSTVDKSKMEEPGRHVQDILTWLTAVYSFQQQCMGAVVNPEYKTSIKNSMVNSTQLTANAVDIVAQISEIIKGFNLGQVVSNINLNSRKLLDVHDDVDTKGYPAWFPAADRRLLALPNEGMTPDVVVAKDGSGHFKTINEAIAAYPKIPMPSGKRYIIYVKAGIYEEQVLVARNQENVLIYGDGPLTVVTGRKNNKMNLATPATATFAAEGKGFIAKSMTFQNSAGPEGHQAVALRVMSDFSVIFNCRMEGYQDTLLYQNYRQFYRDCTISGTIDFIFGMGAALIQNSEIVVRRPEAGQNNLVVTADGKMLPNGVDGLVIQNCRIVGEAQLLADRDSSKYNVYLGRPWQPLASTVIMESELGDLIHPDGWMPWPKVAHETSCNYVEYGNRGDGAGTGRRVPWKTLHVLRDPSDAVKYTAGHFIEGENWLRLTGVPFNLGFFDTATSSNKT